MPNNRASAISRGNMHHHDNIDNGDLRSWEYLTATFDNKQMFTDNIESVVASERVVDQQHDTDNRKRKIHSFSSPDLLRVICEPAPAPIPSYNIEQQQSHPVSKRARSRSVPTIRHQVEISPKLTAARRDETFWPTNLRNIPNQSTDFPNRYPDIFFDPTTQRAIGCFNDNESNFQSYDQSTANQSLSRNCTNYTNSREYVARPGAKYFDLASTDLSLTKIVAEMNYFPNIDGQIGASNKMPHTRSASKKTKHNPHEETVNDTESRLVAAREMQTTKDETFHKLNQSNTVTKSKLATCFTPSEHETIQGWITLHIASMDPPYLQFLQKKLLLPPLTPYNYFFRDERDNIVSQISNETDPLPPPLSEVSCSKLQHLLHQHWYIDPLKKKRQHRKIHGKINFQRLSKVIAERWHQLPKRVREFYREIARYDDIYYHEQLVIIKQRPDIT